MGSCGGAEIADTNIVQKKLVFISPLHSLTF
jgi:hypothetical protein